MTVVLPLVLDGQKLTKGVGFPKTIASDSKQFLELQLSGVPDGVIAKAYFKQSWDVENNIYDETFYNGSLIIPEYLTTLPEETSGYVDYVVSVSVTLFGRDEERGNTNPIEVVLEKPNYSSYTTNSPELPPSQYEQLLGEALHSFVVDDDLSVDSINPVQNKVVSDRLLSLNDRVLGLETHKISVDDALNDKSTNPVQNKVLHSEIGQDRANINGLTNSFNTLEKNVSDLRDSAINTGQKVETLETAVKELQESGGGGVVNAVLYTEQTLTAEQKAQARKNIGVGSGGGGVDGEDGATFTPSVSDDGVLSWTNDKGLTNPSPVNIKGADGKDGNDGSDGYTPVKGVDYFDGNDGKDGQDGQPGKDGYNPVKGKDYFDGKDGADGKDGTSVTVKSVSESNTDGGANVVTFSDGKTLTIKNGSKGEKGDSANIVVDDHLDSNSTNPVQNKVINQAIGQVDAYVKGMGSTVTSLGTNVDALQTQVGSVASATGNITAKVDNYVMPKVTALEEAVEELQDSVGDLEDGVQNIETNTLPEMDERIGKLETESITQETDPTVPAWAKESTKPIYTKSEIGLANVDNVKQYSASNPPPYPVTSVNGKTGAVTLDAAAVGARPSTWTPSASDVGARPSTWTPSASDVGAVPTSRTVNGKALSSNISLTASDVGALPSTTIIPSKTSQLTNDSNFLTAHQDISGKADKSSAETWTFTLEDGSTVTKKVVLA